MGFSASPIAAGLGASQSSIPPPQPPVQVIPPGGGSAGAGGNGVSAEAPAPRGEAPVQFPFSLGAGLRNELFRRLILSRFLGGGFGGRGIG